jgi:hypothetical protein
MQITRAISTPCGYLSNLDLRWILFSSENADCSTWNIEKPNSNGYLG